MRSALRRLSGRVRSRWLWLGFWAVLFVLTHVPVAHTGTMGLRHADKVIHFVLYYLLTRLGGRHYLTAGSGVSVVGLFTWAVVYAAYAALDEWLQPFVGRTMSLGDWAADAAGIAVATVALAIRVRRSGLSGRGETPP